MKHLGVLRALVSVRCPTTCIYLCVTVFCALRIRNNEIIMFRVPENKLTNPMIVIKFLVIIICFLRSLDVHRFLRGAAEAAAGRGSPPPPKGLRRGGCGWLVSLSIDP